MNIKLTAAVLAILGAVVFPLAAQASKPQAVSLTFTMHFTSATTATGTWTSTASDGTFVIDFRGGLKPTGATNSEVNGRFVLKKGTGAYKGLHGNGKIHATLDSSSSAITAVYTGKAHVQDKAR